MAWMTADRGQVGCYLLDALVMWRIRGCCQNSGVDGDVYICRELLASYMLDPRPAPGLCSMTAARPCDWPLRRPIVG